MLECIERIDDFTQVGRETFLDEAVIQDAVKHNLAVMGEAAKRVNDEYRQAHPNIPWRGMAAMRDVLIHNYEQVDLEQVWQVVERDLPPLRAIIVAILPPLDQLEAELAGE
jgi:uncharacterized protein with HEPN domain